MRRSSSILATALLFASALASGCSPSERGSWWYRHPGAMPPDAYGIEQVFLGTGALTPTGVADAALACGVKRMYGSYGPMTGTPSQAQVAQLNSDLHTRGMTSQYLFSDSTYLTNPAALVSDVTSRVVNFDAAHTNLAEHFDAVHLDVEPVQYPECKTATLDPPNCYARVEDLLSLVTSVRQLLAGSDPAVKLFVDIHDWIDLTDLTQGARVAWPAAPTPEASRDAWYGKLDAFVDGVTVFAYDHTNVADAYAAASYEVTHLTHEVRVGINLDPASSFPDVPSLLFGALLLESSYHVPVDLQSVNDVLAAGGC